MSQKYKYKGVDLTDLFNSQNGNISTAYGYTNFPDFQKSGDSHKIYDSTNHGVFKSFAYNTSSVIGHTTIAKEEVLDSNNTTTTVPTWAKAVKFDIQNFNGQKGAQGYQGYQGQKGYQGQTGDTGPGAGHCFYSGFSRNYYYTGGAGGAGGDGGSGGPGGAGGPGGSGGEGGDGGTARISTIIELSETNRNIVFEPEITGYPNSNRITLYDKYEQETVLALYKGHKGAQGAQGGQGGQGAQGGKGHQGGAGHSCQFEHGGKSGSHGSQGSKGSTGSTGAPGSTGSTGAKGAKGAVGTQEAVYNANIGSWTALPNVYRATTSDNINQAKLYYFID